jgi:hypothetical protein
MDQIDLEMWNDFTISNPFRPKTILYLKLDEVPSLPETHLQSILKIDPNFYTAMRVVANWEIPRQAAFKTNTFHQLALSDRSIWYNGKYIDN